MADIKLKPCPFCGGEAEIYRYYPSFHERIRTMVRCKNCRANSGAWGKSDKAIDAWNRRSNENG